MGKSTLQVGPPHSPTAPIQKKHEMVLDQLLLEVQHAISALSHFCRFRLAEAKHTVGDTEPGMQQPRQFHEY